MTKTLLRHIAQTALAQHSRAGTAQRLAIDAQHARCNATVFPRERCHQRLLAITRNTGNA